MSYQAPNWVNGQPPAINATRLNDLCTTVQDLDETMPTKQDKLTFDDAPTIGSSNPVKSNGIYYHYVVAGQKEGETLGTYATAEGTLNISSDYASHAEGFQSEASGQMAHAEGFLTKATGQAAHAEGLETTASENYAHAEGSGTTASGQAAHSEGLDTTASGSGAHAEGSWTQANGDSSHAEGFYVIANGNYQHVFGKYNISNTTDVEIVGWGTSETQKNIRTFDQSGNMTIAGTLTQSSDAQLKTVDGEIPDVSEIHAVRFRWNDVSGQHDDLEHVGYIAQDVEKIAPFMVKKDSNGYKALDYIAFLCAKMELLERRVKELEEKKG